MLKLNKALCGTFLVVFIISTAVASGQEIPHGKWWYHEYAAEKLKLSDEDKRNLDVKFLESRRKLIDLKGALEKERLELEYLMERKTLDKKAVMEQFKKLEAARADLAAERFKFVLEVRKIIGYERFQQLKATFRHFREMRHRKARGAMDHDENIEYRMDRKM